MSNLATWFTPSLKAMSRTKGHSAVAASAYRACIDITDERTGERHKYKNKRGHVSTELIGAKDIKKLWNDAEKSETRKNSLVARELMTPLPHEWTDAQRIAVAHDIGMMLRECYGVAVQVSIHRQEPKDELDDNRGLPASYLNDHAHILFTTRQVDDAGNFGAKTRVLDEGYKNGEMTKLREAVTNIMNEHGKKNGATWVAYAGKFKDIDPDHIPTVHIARNCPEDVAQELDILNSEILEGRDQLKRLSDESKQITQEVKEAIEKAKNAEPLPVVKQPDPVAPEVVSTPPAPPEVSPLEVAYTLKDSAEEYTKARSQYRKNTESRKKWSVRLAEIKAENPSIWEKVQDAGAKFTKRITMNLFTEEEGSLYRDRKRRKDEALKAIAKCDTANKTLKSIMDDKKAQYTEYNGNPTHRALIEASMAQSPDARRKTAPEAPKPSEAYKPSSMELETAPAPP